MMTPRTAPCPHSSASTRPRPARPARAKVVSPTKVAGAAALTLGLLLAGPASAERLMCAASGMTLTVEVDATAGRCAVDGRRASLQRAFDPVVCHLATPALLILSIARDGGFIWEDTGTGRVVRGTCRPG